ncbi:MULTISPECIES: hypothetical protein [unclassified Mesorhizobium]|uniref:hypothetical protein n=1 Tax=unclassified Mesorhizobium TaxID=325217 RepID=UPI0012DE5BA4|nr:MULTISPECIES: hypothetical protein [unclassified Mesorhizobium]
MISRLDPAIRSVIFHWRGISHRLVCFFDYAETSRRTARKSPGKAANGLILLLKGIEMGVEQACKAECGRSPVD